METGRGKNMPGESLGRDLPIRRPGGGYGATAKDIACGYKSIPDTDTDSRTGPYPAAPRGQPETLSRNKDGI